MNGLSKGEVLLAVSKACNPYSVYIGHEIDKLHVKKIAAGGRGFSPRRSLILSRLRALEQDGLLTRGKTPIGFYGYSWEITPAGRATLSPEPHQ